MYDDTKPCPWCGSTEGDTKMLFGTSAVTDIAEQGLFMAWQCLNCRAQGPVKNVRGQNVEEAIETLRRSWNNRGTT